MKNLLKMILVSGIVSVLSIFGVSKTVPPKEGTGNVRIVSVENQSSLTLPSGTLIFSNGNNPTSSSTLNWDNSSGILSSKELRASTTLQVTGNGIFYNKIGIGTTSPSQLLSLETGNSTSTIYLSSLNGNKAGCIQLEGQASTTYRIYVKTDGTLATEAGSCN